MNQSSTDTWLYKTWKVKRCWSSWTTFTRSNPRS